MKSTSQSKSRGKKIVVRFAVVVAIIVFFLVLFELFMNCTVLQSLGFQEDEEGHIISLDADSDANADADADADVNADAIIHPIDELITQDGIREGSAIHIALSILKNYSLPESYGEEIETEDNIEKETQRCTRYGFEFNKEVNKRRRRIFWGSLIADDSWHAIAAHAAESFGLYHTVALIESNTTQTMTKRDTRFHEGSLNLKVLQSGIFGPKTNVTVDFYVSEIGPEEGTDDEIALLRENLQRGAILKIWKENGMQPDDIGFVGDIDENFTRDFLLALQTCNIPLFQPGQSCYKPKIIASTLVFEMTPECSFPGYRWHHPDVAIGECIDTIGDSDLHKPGLRTFAYKNTTLGTRLPGYGLEYWDYSKMPETNTTKMYPLWRPVDFRNADGGARYGELPIDGQTGYHFHNFFDSIDILRTKYKTYGHSVGDADFKPVAKFHHDLDRGVRCIMGRPDDDIRPAFPYNRGGFEGIEGRRPIIFEHESYRNARTREIKEMIEADEKKFKKDD